MNKLKKPQNLLIYVLVVVLILVSICCVMFYIKQKTIMSYARNEKEGKNEEEPILIMEDENECVDEVENMQDEEIESLPITEKKEENNKTPINKIQTNKTTYFIRINYYANVVTIYKKEDNGEYVPVKAMTCSTGTWTPKSGTYKTSNKYVWGALNGGVWGQYCTRITGSILFHSVPYTAKDKSALEYWEYDKLGTTASQGCVRLTVIDAKWIYNNIPRGTEVEFYSDSNAGPLGKPSAKKISNEADEYRNWDPTDPDDNNPWKNWKAPVIEHNIENENKQENLEQQDIPNIQTENKQNTENVNDEEKEINADKENIENKPEDNMDNSKENSEKIEVENDESSNKETENKETQLEDSKQEETEKQEIKTETI